MTRRIGKFHVSHEIIKNWEKALPIMNNFVVIRAESIFATEHIEYTAFSPLFEEVEEYLEPPYYNIYINSVGGKQEVSVSKK